VGISLFNKKSKLVNVCLICEGAKVSGDLVLTIPCRVDGTVTGSITCTDKVLVGPTGVVNGDIHGADVTVHGRVNGHVKASAKADIQAEAFVGGTVSSNQLNIAASAVVEGLLIKGRSSPEVNEADTSLVVNDQTPSVSIPRSAPVAPEDFQIEKTENGYNSPKQEQYKDRWF
jgi:cytoskeletal protein CcmA (bactofilin family)